MQQAVIKCETPRLELSRTFTVIKRLERTTIQKVIKLVQCSLKSWFCNKLADHGGRRGYVAQALTQWRHSVASSEALDVLHWMMHPALYRRICMKIQIASVLPAFFVIVNFIVGHNRPNT